MTRKPFRPLVPKAGQLESNIPIPGPLPGFAIADFDTMDVNQSFLVPWPKKDGVERLRHEVSPYERKCLQINVGSIVNRRNYSAGNQSRAVPKKWIQRTVDAGVRVWRIK
jgi:hypothetical protein